MLIIRPFWIQRIEQAWLQRSIIWLMGVRRTGKTSLCKSLSDIEYYDCELARVRQQLEDVEGFLESKRGKRLVLDEVHRLANPSEILKVAADHFPEVKIIATGSSTLGASAKFRDTLTGRKKEVWLTPLLLQEGEIFGDTKIEHRLLFGGLPSFFNASVVQEADLQEWIDAYWARDIQELFSVGKRYAFQKFTELLLAQSGGQFEATRFATPCEVSRQTIANYLAVLEATFVVHVIRPFSTHKTTEIVAAPKVYGFDTGFVCYAKSWRDLRKEDTGLLWEHCVLNELHGQLQIKQVNYWRTKYGHEIDFVVREKKSNAYAAIECKFSGTHIDTRPGSLAALATNIIAFRNHYPHGSNYVVTHDIVESFERRVGDLVIAFVTPEELVRRLA